MIKTSGYRVSPTEIEEAGYATGLVRDAVALGVDDSGLGQRIVLIVTPAGGNLDAEACWTSCEGGCRCTWFQAVWTSATTSHARRTASSTGRCCARSSRRDQADDRRVRTHRRTLAVGGMSLDRLTARVGSTPYFAYDRRLLTERVELLRRHCPAPPPQLRGQGEPDAGSRPAPGRARRFPRCRVGARNAHRSGHPDAGESGQLRRTRQDRGRDRPGRRRRRHHRNGVARPRPNACRDRGGARRHPSCGLAGQPRLPGEGVRHADGRRTAAVRRRRRASPRPARRSRRRRHGLPRASTCLPVRRTSTPRSSCDAQRKTVGAGPRARREGARPGAIRQSRRWIRHSVLRQGQAARSRRDRREPCRSDREPDRPGTSRGRGSASNSGVTSWASAGSM